jgi:CRP/FNR family transcriptional regulator
MMQKSPSLRMDAPGNTHSTTQPSCLHQSKCCINQQLKDASGLCLSALKRRQRLRPRHVLFRQNTPSNTLFLVREGLLKTQRVTPDGQLVIAGFYFPGEIMCLETLDSRRHDTEAVALETSEVCAFDRQRLIDACSREPLLNNWLISRMGRRLQQKEADLCWIMRMNRGDRVLRFFVELHHRLAACASSGECSLPRSMTKHDIALYLHMSPETLSRTIAELRRDSLLDVGRHSFTLRDIDLAQSLIQI